MTEDFKGIYRFSLKAVGESGQGVNSVGEIVTQALNRSGLYVFGYREYPSLIRGGNASYQTDVSDQPIKSSSQKVDLLVAMSRRSIHHYLRDVRPGGVVIHDIFKLDLSEAEQQFCNDNNISIEYIPAYQLAVEAGGNKLMTNTVLVGVAWQLLGEDTGTVDTMLERIFAKKPDVIDPNKACLQKGFTFQLEKAQPFSFQFQKQADLVADDMLLTGNHALALGAVSAGVRAYFAYPMTPSSSILSYLASVYHQTGMLVKQIEDEISVAEMTLGAMFMGTRALCATSGGGFDLMTETVSLAGMTETPFVCVLAQRPGPATGLPTWTAASDLNLAIYAGHGEYTRLVIAASDIESCYLRIQEAFNLAEEYQIPVLVLTEKQIAESLFQVHELPAAVPIERHLVAQDQLQTMQPHDRFKITDNGISPRWLPGSCDATYNGNSDEHLEDGSLTEEAAESQAMYDKRLCKEIQLKQNLPEPELLGESGGMLLVGWGSVKNTVQDALSIWKRWYPDEQIGYLHYEYVFPLKTEKLVKLAGESQHLVLVEQNAYGQLGNLIQQQTDLTFKTKWLKYDGRPFFIEDILDKLAEVTGKRRLA